MVIIEQPDTIFTQIMRRYVSAGTVS